MKLKRKYGRVLLLALISLTCTACGPPKVQPAKLNAGDRAQIVQAQQELDETLKTHAPAIFSRLHPPADAAAIKRLRKALDGSRRESLELWFKWHNGGDNVELLPLGRMMSIREAIDDRRMNQSIPLIPSSRRRDIKLLDDGAGDGYFLNLAAIPPFVYYEMLEDPGMTSYGTLPEFLQFLNTVQAAGITTVKEDGKTRFDLDAYEELEAEYLAKVRNQG